VPSLLQKPLRCVGKVWNFNRHPTHATGSIETQLSPNRSSPCKAVSSERRDNIKACWNRAISRSLAKVCQGFLARSFPSDRRLFGFRCHLGLALSPTMYSTGSFPCRRIESQRQHIRIIEPAEAKRRAQLRLEIRRCTMPSI
jgi:hypothetical protein